MSQEDSQFLSQLADAMVRFPRASLADLAKAVGVSKATLYRYCQTRENLVDRLETHTVMILDQLTTDARLAEGDPAEGLYRLNTKIMEIRELTTFLLYYWKDLKLSVTGTSIHQQSLDALFLRGQSEGVFRLDISAAGLTEIWFSLVAGLVEAERNGRIASQALVPGLHSFFLFGAANPAALKKSNI